MPGVHTLDEDKMENVETANNQGGGQGDGFREELLANASIRRQEDVDRTCFKASSRSDKLRPLASSPESGRAVIAEAISRHEVMYEVREGDQNSRLVGTLPWMGP